MTSVTRQRTPRSSSRLDHLSVLKRLLARVGSDVTVRAVLTHAIAELEKDLSLPGRSVRDELTGPLVDALHENAGVLSKRLANGVMLEYLYRSRIARELVMSPHTHPDHVWEPQTTKLLLYLSEHAKQVLVGGAYMGDQAVLMAHQMRATGGICHAFEPNVEQAAMLKRNAELNALDNIWIRQTALWSTSGRFMALSGEDAEAHGHVQDSDTFDIDEHSISTTTIDDYGAQHGLEQVDVIMLDIEGAELEALCGAQRYLSMTAEKAPRLVFEIHSRYSNWSNGLENADIIRFVQSFGYQVWAIRDVHGNRPMGHKPIELISPEETVIAGPPHGFNMLALKQSRLITTDRFRVCRHVSPKLLSHKDPAIHAPLDGWD